MLNRRGQPTRMAALLCALVTAITVSGCTLFTPKSAPAVKWTFTVVRHAERADDGTDDPPLTPAGAQRAGRLAVQVAPQHGVAVYASPLQRAQQTAAPAASAWSVAVTTYPADRTGQQIVQQAEQEHASGPILIVGHSNTVPTVVATLCGCPVDPMAETEFSLLYEVEIGTDGSVLKVIKQLDY